MSKQRLGSWTVDGGYASSVPRVFLSNILAWGSLNALLTGLGFVRNFGGLDQIAGKDGGSWQFFQTDNTFAGLGNGTTYGKGSVFKVQRVLALTGAGPLRVTGDDIGVNADSTLQYVKKSGGVYVSPAYPTGQARPSSQTIYPKNTPGTGHTGMDGAVATVIWRIDSVTGQVSLASLSSNVLSLSGQSVIQPFPATDTAQDYWGIGVCKPGFGTAPVFYQLKTDLGGEVAETTLAYTRTIADGSITITDTTLTLDGATPLANRFTAADVGRRVAIAGCLDSWIVTVTDAFNAETFDPATATAANEDTVITHAVDGILRAVEISWTAESLQGQELAPYDAYPPQSNLAWAGILMDAMFTETTDGILYVGVPGFIGSFPPKNTLFPPEPATLYLEGSDGLIWRWSRNMLMALTYIGGPKPMDLQTVWKNTGILYPQNAAIGKGGRVIAWSGKPVRLGAGGEPDIEFAFKVYKDFEGWNLQTATKPVITAFDPDAQFDIWAYDRKIMAVRGGTDLWCAPIDAAPYLIDLASATGTITCANLIGLDGATMTVGGIEFTFSSVTNSFDNLLYNPAGTLTDLAAAIAVKINDSEWPSLEDVTCTSDGPVVTVTHLPGADGNAFTLVSGTAGSRIVMSGATLEGGADDEYLISAVIVDNKLRFSTNADTELFLYLFDEGGGSTMTLKTAEVESSGESDTITQLAAVVHVDDTDTVDISIVKDFDDDNPILVESFTPAVSPDNQTLQARPNIRCAAQHSVLVEIVSNGKNVGVQSVVTYGEANEIYLA